MIWSSLLSQIKKKCNFYPVHHLELFRFFVKKMLKLRKELLLLVVEWGDLCQ